MAIKYIVFRNPETGFREFDMFSDTIMHSSRKQANVEILGAGFVGCSVDAYGCTTFRCKGESTSLGVKSRGELDSDVLNSFLRRQELK